MKEYLVISCPCCGFRHPLRRFHRRLEPILLPLGFACSRGRARGFVTTQRLPWTALPKFKGTDAWESILGVYQRLAYAVDSFYLTCNLLTPQMTELVEGLRARLSYPDAYLTAGSPTFVEAYVDTRTDIAEAYSDVDYSETYAVSMYHVGEVL